MADWKEYKGVVEKNSIEAVRLVGTYLGLMGFCRDEEKNFVSKFVKSIEPDGVYDAVEMRGKINELCDNYDSNIDLNQFDYKFKRIGTKKISKLEKLTDLSKSVNFLFSEKEKGFYMNALGESVESIISNIPVTPYTVELFNTSSLGKKTFLLKTLMKYNYLDKQLIYNLGTLKQDGSRASVKWSQEIADSSCEIINDYAKEYGPIIVRKNDSVFLGGIYAKLHKDTLYGPKLRKALKGELNS